jgi:hypothetical protein
MLAQLLKHLTCGKTQLSQLLQSEMRSKTL